MSVQLNCIRNPATGGVSFSAHSSVSASCPYPTVDPRYYSSRASCRSIRMHEYVYPTTCQHWRSCTPGYIIGVKIQSSSNYKRLPRDRASRISCWRQPRRLHLACLPNGQLVAQLRVRARVVGFLSVIFPASSCFNVTRLKNNMMPVGYDITLVPIEQYSPNNASCAHIYCLHSRPCCLAQPFHC